MTSVVSAKNEPGAARRGGRGRGLAPGRRPALGGSRARCDTRCPAAGEGWVPTGAGGERDAGREAEKGGPPQRPLATGGGPQTQQRSGRRLGTKRRPRSAGGGGASRGRRGRSGVSVPRRERQGQHRRPARSSANSNPGRAGGQGRAGRARDWWRRVTHGGRWPELPCLQQPGALAAALRAPAGRGRARGPGAEGPAGGRVQATALARAGAG